jgi:hypothetical protein
MSFTCPKLSSNSAEGSPSGSQFFVPAGLQAYSEKGTPVTFTYKIGQENKACWSSGTSNDGKVKCSQTNFQDARAWIVVNNQLASDIYFFHLSFTCPKLSTNSAEGSLSSGLQPYSKNGTFITFTYNIGEANKACWNDGSRDDGTITCSQTNVFPPRLDRWITTVAKTKNIGKLKLSELCIPGTHDSACYDMEQSVGSPWSQTQVLNFTQQLQAGARYFDLRLRYNNGNFIFCHGDWDTKVKLTDLLLQLTSFLGELGRNKEIVILDFTHFDGFSTKTEQQKFIDGIVNSGIQSYLVPKGTSSDTLDSIWAKSKNIIVSVDFDISSLNTKNLIWSGNELFAPGWNGIKFWANTNDVNTLATFLDEIVAQAPYAGKLWVLQNILTPVWYKPWGTISSLAPEANAKLFTDGSNWKAKMNIVFQDYYDWRLTAEAVDINIHRV